MSNERWSSYLHVPVDLLGLPVATEKTTQDSHAPHPWQLLWHTSIGCTLSLTWLEETILQITVWEGWRMGRNITRESVTHHNQCDVPCGVPACSCGSERGNETVTGFLMIKPSFTSFLICWPAEQMKYRQRMSSGAELHSLTQWELSKAKSTTHESLHWQSHWSRWGPAKPSSCHNARRWTPSASGAWACWFKQWENSPFYKMWNA